MKFSMIFEAQLANPTREREHQVLHDCVEQAVYAEEMGFDRIWAVEHHALKWYAHMSAPEVFLSWVAARTSRIRIGHGVVCMPFNYNHPIRAAERVAMLDVLSGGRLDVGAGRGATRQEMSLVGVDVDDTYPQMEEALRMIGHMWEKDEFEWHGLLDIDPHPILPRPAQEPHPPLYLACTKRDTVELAAELGVGALVMGFAGPDEVAALRRIYDGGIERRTGERFVSHRRERPLHRAVPHDRARRRRPGRAGRRPGPAVLRRGHRALVRRRSAADRGRDRGRRRGGDDRVARPLRRPPARGRHPRRPAGRQRPSSSTTPTATRAAAIDYVERLEAAGADEIMCLIQMGTVPQEACLETIRHWGETVIPHFRAKERS